MGKPNGIASNRGVKEINKMNKTKNIEVRWYLSISQTLVILYRGGAPFNRSYVESSLRGAFYKNIITKVSDLAIV